MCGETLFTQFVWHTIRFTHCIDILKRYTHVHPTQVIGKRVLSIGNLFVGMI